MNRTIVLLGLLLAGCTKEADVRTPVEDGGQVYPMDYTGPHKSDQTGMTLRDYLAAHAPTPPAEIDRRDVNAEAGWRWKYADAMIKARRTKQERSDE